MKAGSWTSCEAGMSLGWGSIGHFVFEVQLVINIRRKAGRQKVC